MPKYNTPTDFESGGFDIFLNEIDPTDIYSDAMVETESPTDSVNDELFNLLVLIKAQAAYYQSCHWNSQGTSFYGDHLLFERLYTAVGGEIDMIGERVVTNIGSIDIVCLMACVSDTVEGWVNLKQDVITTSLRSEVDLRIALTALIDNSNKEKSYGVANMVQGIFDTHETHIYLLQQRLDQTCTKNASMKTSAKKRMKKASLNEFLKVSNNTLINKSDKDFWKVRKDATGGYVIEKLYDSEVV